MRKNFGSKPVLYPQLVAIIGTYNEDGTPNAMNAAWGGMCANDKVLMCISEGHKTTKNILRDGVFTVSIADAEHVTEADYLGIESGNSCADKIAKAGLHAFKAENINAPLFEEFAFALECRFIEYNEYGVIGEIINASADERILDENGSVDPEKLQAISFDPINMTYLKVGGKVGNAFSDGKKLI